MNSTRTKSRIIANYKTKEIIDWTKQLLGVFFYLFNFYTLVSLKSVVLDSFSRYTAAVVMEMDYDRIDINQCPPSQGNDRPNRFASTARCKETTEVTLHWKFYS